MNINLSLENKQINPGVINLKQFTTGTDTLVFEMDSSSMHETTDLSKMSAYAVCDMSGRIDEVKLTTSIVEDKLQITWHVTGYTTDVAGTITYQIVFKDIENEKAVLWTSHKAIIFVNSSIPADDHIAAKYPSILQQWEERMNSTDTTNKENFDNLVKDVTEKIENGEFDGKSVIYGEENPSDEIGNDGDVYIKTTETEPYPYYLFTKDNGTWTPQFTVRGKNGYDGNPVGTIASFAGELPEGYEEVAPPFCNENILDNADFKSGIINQQGQVVYENSGYQKQYGIDRWYSIHSKVNTQYKDLGYLTISVNEQQEGYFNQPLEIQAGTYCLAIKVININRGNINVYIEQAQPQHEETIDKVGLHTFVFKTTSKGSGISFRLNDFSGDIEFIKLEHGEDFTGMPIWNEALELYKCKHEFEIIRGRMFNSFQHSSTNAIFKIDYQPKRKVPVVSYTKETGVNRHDGSLITVTSWKNDPITNESFTLHVGHKETSSNVLYYRTGMGFIIDARDY